MSSKKCRVLLVGDDTFEIYVKAFYDAFCELGYTNVKLFATNHYTKADKDGRVCSLYDRVQNKLSIGPNIDRMNKALIREVEQFRPELIFLYSTRAIYPCTVKRIKSLGTTIFMYNNDNPFASYYPKYFWRNYRNSLKYADMGFVYRQSNEADYKKMGCAKVELLRSYYIDKRNFYISNTEEIVPKVVFIGHKEDDDRYEYIRAALDAGIEIGVPKRNWKGFEEENPLLIRLENCMEKYNEQMNAATISVVFLSALNKDTYTRRCFEIPATKKMLFSVYTDDIASMFEENKEIVFFRNKREFVSKLQYYLKHEEECKCIGEAGYERLMRDGHEVKDRVRQVMEAYDRR